MADAKESPNEPAERISIIVPAFQAASSIRRCLLSLIGQSMQDIEIIVVYKPCDDNTLSEIQAIGDPRIHILIQEEDSGPGGARNLGIQAACGKYLGFVETDDYIEHDFFEKLYRSIIRTNADIACAGIEVNGKTLVAYRKQRIFTNFRDKIRYAVFGSSFDKLFKLTLLTKNDIKFSEGKRWEDNIFWVKSAFFSHKIVTVPNTVYYYFPQEWTVEYKAKLTRDAEAVIYELANFSQQETLTLPEKHALRAFILRSFAFKLLQTATVRCALQTCFGLTWYDFLHYYGDKGIRKIIQLYWKLLTAVHQGVKHG